MELVYEVKDTLDTCSTEATPAAARPKKSRFLRLDKVRSAKKTINLAEKVKSLRLDNMKEMLAKANEILAAAGPNPGGEEPVTLVTKVNRITLLS